MPRPQHLLLFLPALLAAACAAPPPTEPPSGAESATAEPEAGPAPEPPPLAEEAPAPAAAEEAPPPPPAASAIVEHAEPLPRPPAGTLGTGPYRRGGAEGPFFDRLSPEERAPGGMFEDYSITGKTGTYVGWLGIVRGLAEDAGSGTTRLLVENKYFDGLQDTHILCTSFNGGGDFVVEVPGTGHGIRLLSMVRVYGTVAEERDGLPRLRAEYVRHFDWGLFTFIRAYGNQKGNAAWRDRCRVPLDDIYAPFPPERYYRAILGERADFAGVSVPE